MYLKWFEDYVFCIICVSCPFTYADNLKLILCKYKLHVHVFTL